MYTRPIRLILPLTTVRHSRIQSVDEPFNYINYNSLLVVTVSPVRAIEEGIALCANLLNTTNILRAKLNVLIV